MDVKKLRDVDLDLSGVRVDRERKIERLNFWRHGKLGPNAEASFEAWLVEAIARERVIVRGPGFGRRVVNFVSAARKHVRAKRPQASPAVIAARLDVCRGSGDTPEPCELYNSDNGRCRHKKCGCNLRRKAAWLDQSCPIKLWPGDDGGSAENGEIEPIRGDSVV